MFKFIHAADIHLDSPLRGLERYEGAPVEQIREASRVALENLVALAIDEQVAFVLIAGDLYDGDWREFRTGLHFVRQATKLRDAGIQVYLIAGNHDAANRMTKSLKLPENVTFFDSKSAHTVRLESLNVSIHGQSFATPAVTEDLSVSYPNATAGSFNIGLLHTCCTGREGHERYAPCSVEGLKLKGYDYWALGHIHIRETLCEKPYIAFSGNLQGRHIRETGAKGCLLVTVDESLHCQVDFRPLDVVRWELAILPIGQLVSIDDLLDSFAKKVQAAHDAAEGRVLALRVNLTGQTQLHDTLLAKRHYITNELRSMAADVSSGNAWLEKIVMATTSLASRSGSASIADDAKQEILSLFQEAMSDPSRLEGLGFDLSDAIKKLPAELRDSSESTDHAWFQSIVAEAQSRLLDSLQLREGQS